MPAVLLRGDLGSYPEEAIEARVRSAVEQGATQIWLTSEDTGRLIRYTRAVSR